MALSPPFSHLAIPAQKNRGPIQTLQGAQVSFKFLSACKSGHLHLIFVLYIIQPVVALMNVFVTWFSLSHSHCLTLTGLVLLGLFCWAYWPCTGGTMWLYRCDLAQVVEGAVVR